MSTLSTTQIVRLLEPYSADLPSVLVDQLSIYLDLLLKWNARTNLTAIRDPAQIVQRHFGESLFTACHLPECMTLLDFGSGAGFPGLPIQLARPDLQVTLAESQNKKASFLNEVVRTLGLPTRVWAGRVQDLSAEMVFDVVTLRAVDDPETALEAARVRVKPGGLFALLSGEASVEAQAIPVPGLRAGFLNLMNVPRGT